MLKNKLKFLVVPLMLLAAVTAATKMGYIAPGPSQKLKDNGRVSVTTDQVRYINKVPKLALTGSLEGETSAVISAKIAGRIERILVEDGQRVSAGQPLVVLESVELDNAVRMAADNVHKAQANYQNILADFNRYSLLYKQNAISKQQLDSIETRLRVAENDLSSARAGLDNAGQQREYSKITAPVDGVVANKNATVGQVVSAGLPLMNVENISKVYAVVNVEQKEIGRVKAGMPAEITVDAYRDKVFGGKVEVINPVAGSSNRMFRTKIILDNADNLLKPGMFVKANIILGRESQVLAAPRSAIIQKQGLSYVFVPHNGQLVRRQVETGEIINEYIEITAGIEPKTEVVTSNVTQLKAGDSIAVSR